MRTSCWRLRPIPEEAAGQAAPKGLAPSGLAFVRRRSRPMSELSTLERLSTGGAAFDRILGGGLPCAP